MYELMPFPLSGPILAEYGGSEGLNRELESLGCQGVEAIWAGKPVPEEFPNELAVGWHLTFFTDWLNLTERTKRTCWRSTAPWRRRGGFTVAWGRST